MYKDQRNRNSFTNRSSHLRICIKCDTSHGCIVKVSYYLEIDPL